VGHQAGIEDHVDASVRLDRAVDQPLDLVAFGDVGSDHAFSGEIALGGQRLQSIKPARADHQLCPIGSEPSRRRLTEPAARTRDYDDFSSDIPRHDICPGGSEGFIDVTI
jgi:hypothetical protein